MNGHIIYEIIQTLLYIGMGVLFVLQSKRIRRLEERIDRISARVGDPERARAEERK